MKQHKDPITGDQLSQRILERQRENSALMRVGSLFTGIGGLDLGLQRADFQIAWQVEIDPWCRQLLKRHWSEVPKFGDIKLCGAHNLEQVDLLCGGFPCQDISTAGKKIGIDGDRSGLWREQARIIAELRPRYVLIENVAALLYAIRGSDGRKRPAAIERVLRDLAQCGYDATWRVCSAAEFGAPHLRKRVFIVAYLPDQRDDAKEMGNPPGQRREVRRDTTGLHAESNAPGRQREYRDKGLSELADTDDHRRWERANQSEPEYERVRETNTGEDGNDGQMADAAIPRRTGRKYPGRTEPPEETSFYELTHCREVLADARGTRLEEWNGNGTEAYEARPTSDQRGGCQRPPQSLLGGIFAGFPPRLDQVGHQWPAGPGQEQYAWEPPRVIQDKLKDRVARLKGLGNAALPQIAEMIGRGIQWHNAQCAREREC